MEKQRLILITCTYPRRASTRKRKVERPVIRHFHIDRMVSILKFVEPPVDWIILDDQATEDPNLVSTLRASNLEKREGWNIHHFTFGPTRSSGNAQKNIALNYASSTFDDGIVYIMDDDNFWDPSFFEIIRQTKRLSAFPIGNMGSVHDGIERPIVDEHGVVVDWQARFKWRKFCVDMGEFAFHVDLMRGIQGSKTLWPKDEHGGEDQFLRQFVSHNSEFEPLMTDLEKALVHHNEPLGSDWEVEVYKSLGLEPVIYPSYVNGF